MRTTAVRSCAIRFEPPFPGAFTLRVVGEHHGAEHCTVLGIDLPVERGRRNAKELCRGRDVFLARQRDVHHVTFSTLGLRARLALVASYGRDYRHFEAGLFRGLAKGARVEREAACAEPFLVVFDDALARVFDVLEVRGGGSARAFRLDTLHVFGGEIRFFQDLPSNRHDQRDRDETHGRNRDLLKTGEFIHDLIPKSHFQPPQGKVVALISV